ncbi:metallophosphoesterase [Pelagicoccus sp. SDUM812005]|uniref:metallophosphoesterase n=1 Tax=Pelagicoccus sp. SDUM812005 TaxID=3041257 RepID=UPI00280D0799|nr:metallophosphoesterase [Pelagicoccus sp. SDUM812005]MDQ8180447.1 metallophosphoesterase [Pelagicoccus sp. SDUM812005]
MLRSTLTRASAALFALLFAAGQLRGGDALDPAPPGTYTVVVLPDTQGYTGIGTKRTPESDAPVSNAVFDAHTQWVVENQEKQNIVFVSHVGDIVDRNERRQWEVARRAMDRIHGLVPYGISVGNHDMTSEGNSSLFQSYFPAARFESFSWYGGHFQAEGLKQEVSGNNANSVQYFSMGESQFVFLHLECNAPDEVLDWANAILRDNRDRVALVTTHMGLGPAERPQSNDGYITDPKGRMRWSKRHGERGNSPQQMWEKCFRKHPNLVAIFSGDQSRTEALRQETKGDAGNTVHELLSDYTSSGPIRLYRFNPNAGTIDVFTFETGKEELVFSTDRNPARESHRFKLDYQQP